MIIDKTTVVHTTNKNIAHYKQYSPFIKSGDTITIDIDKLTLGSKHIIKVSCDTCGEEKNMSYKNYNRITNNNTEKHYCNKCKNEKTIITNNIKYGVDNVFQSDIIKLKSKLTCIEKYGVDYYQKTLEYKNKVKATNLERYGVEYPMQNDDIKNKNNYEYSPEKIEKIRITTRNHYARTFPDKSNIIHDYKYDYTQVIYLNMYTKVNIICPNHGTFSVKPGEHIYGKVGCPICKKSKGELLVSKLLKDANIIFTQQKSYPDLKHKSLLFFDFYLPDYNICIEYDGEQHFREISYWGGIERFEIIKLRDNLKNEYCEKNNITLLRVNYKETEIEIKEKIINFCDIKH